MYQYYWVTVIKSSSVFHAAKQSTYLFTTTAMMNHNNKSPELLNTWEFI